MSKDKSKIKVISPCFCVKEDTFNMIEELSKATGLSRNSIVEIALWEVNEYDLQTRKFHGISTESETPKTLFDYIKKEE